MLSVVLCLFAFMFAYAAGRRSLVAGLATVFTVGYFYGILRANVPEPSSHFIFDAAVVGLQFVDSRTKVSNPIIRLATLCQTLHSPQKFPGIFPAFRESPFSQTNLRGNSLVETNSSQSQS